jgi:nicotinate phosphoribosyltransferase
MSIGTDIHFNTSQAAITSGTEKLVLTKFPQLIFEPNYAEQLKIDMTETRIDVWWDKTLELSIQGPFSSSCLLTTPIQAILNELILETLSNEDISQIKHRVIAGVSYLDMADPERSRIVFSEIGSRRRINLEYQLDVISDILRLAPDRLIGTGNPYISEQLCLPLLGMMHHDYILAATAGYTGKTRIAAERNALLQWHNSFGPRYNTALSDTFGFDHFLVAFDKSIAVPIQGVRHDSGNPINWAKRMAIHYDSMDITPQKKIFVFTDSLDWSNLPVIFSQVQTICNPIFELGGNFTGAGPMHGTDMSIKLIMFDQHPVRKLSDDANKVQPEFLAPMPVKNLLTIF